MRFLLSSFVTFAAVFPSSMLRAQDPSEPPRPLERIRPGSLAEEYLDEASTLVGRALLANTGYEKLEHLCDGIGPRLSGSDGAERAVAWCAERMREEGFQNVRLQKVMVPVWTRGHCKVVMTTPGPMELVALALGGSVGTPDGPVVAEVIEVTRFEQLEELGREAIEGKIVYYHHNMKPSTRTFSDYGANVSLRTQGAARAAQYGAIASITRSIGTDRVRLPHTGAMQYDEGGRQIPAVAIAAEDALMLHRLLRRGQKVEISIDLGCKTLPDRESANVIGEVRGREKPEEIVVVGGHLDSWDVGTGAIDDGAGCVITWEAARLLMATGLVPRRTVRVVLFMNEENGLAGGREYGRVVEETQEKHVAALEADSGAGAPWGFSCGASRPAISAVQDIAQLLKGIASHQVRPGGSGGADISPLHWQGVPCLGLKNDMTEYFDFHHTPADTLDKVDPHALARNIAAVAVMTYCIAEMETPLAELK